MTKKEYLQPSVDVFDLRLQPVLGDFSVTGEGLKADPDPDESDDDNRARRTYNAWDDEEEEDY